MSKLTLGGLFSGSGGFELGGLLSGIRPVWASEIEPFSIRVTTKRLPQVVHLGNINQINGGEIAPVDIITFGSPCTDLSLNKTTKSKSDKQIIKWLRNPHSAEYKLWGNGVALPCVLFVLSGIVWAEKNFKNERLNRTYDLLL